MKILLYGINFAPELTGIGKYTGDMAAWLAGAKAWLHVQDYEVNAAFDLGLLKGPWLRRMVAGGERWLMRRFDVVSTISQRMREQARVKGVDAGRLMMFPNWVDVAAIAPGGMDCRAAACPELVEGLAMTQGGSSRAAVWR